MKDYKFLLESDIPDCSKACIKGGVSCPIKDCRQWIDHEEDLNCTSVAVEANGSMTLREIADRLNVSFVRVKQIEDKVLDKLEKRLSKEFGIKRGELREFIMTGFQ
tara:strand:+ start:438 stop:755 length:318 start_codon:yes stop_codon:yes gene_type:complete